MAERDRDALIEENKSLREQTAKLAREREAERKFARERLEELERKRKADGSMLDRLRAELDRLRSEAAQVADVTEPSQAEIDAIGANPEEDQERTRRALLHILPMYAELGSSVPCRPVGHSPWVPRA